MLRKSLFFIGFVLLTVVAIAALMAINTQFGVIPSKVDFRRSYDVNAFEKTFGLVPKSGEAYETCRFGMGGSGAGFAKMRISSDELQSFQKSIGGVEASADPEISFPFWWHPAGNLTRFSEVDQYAQRFYIYEKATGWLYVAVSD
jgi:hypothetical protein